MWLSGAVFCDEATRCKWSCGIKPLKDGFGHSFDDKILGMKNRILTRTQTLTIRARNALARLVGGCVNCGESSEQSAFSPRLCGTCAESVDGQDAYRCGTCAVRLETDDARCLVCINAAPYLRHVGAFGDYAGALQHLILRYKFHQMLHAAPVLGDMLSVALRMYALENSPDVIIPVPQFEPLTVERGFVPLLHLLKQVDFESVWSEPPELDCAATLRVQHSQLQVSSTSEQRRKQIKNAFVVSRDLTGLKVLLVDDVYTTGATLNELARVCLGAGAVRVDALVLARARRHQ